jgi:DNA-binding MarR family transcriptional regulator
MTDQRSRLESHIVAHPGLHFNALARDLDLAPGQVQYHLRRLAERGTVVEAELYGRTHYYPPECTEWERGALALARRETSRDVLFYLIEHGESKPATVAEAVGIARSTLEWHLDRLVERDLVRKRRDESNRVSLVLTRPEETVRLLSDIRPSLPERFVDRFERLVDSLLSK